MKSYRFSFILLLLAALTVAACEKPTPDVKEPEKKGETIPTPAPAPTPNPTPTPSQLERKTNEVNVFKWVDWIYFSFRQNKVVEVKDPAKDLSWDVGFHIVDFRTNGGESGSGKGAAAKTDLKELTTDIKLDGLQWETDKTGVGISTQMAKPADKTISKSLVLSDNVLKPDLTTMPPPITASKNVWLLKDAEGKVLAFRIVECNWEGPMGKRILPMKFEYAYLSEGK